MDQKKIGKFIAGCRREAGMTQQALSERLGVSDRTVGNWENGRNLPDPSLYKPLCDELGITLAEFFSGERIPEEKMKERTDDILIKTVSENRAAGFAGMISYILIVCGVMCAFLSALRHFSQTSSIVLISVGMFLCFSGICIRAILFQQSTGKKINNTGMGFCSSLTLVFIILKLTGNIKWSWLWVLSPAWLGVCAAAAAIAVLLTAGAVVSRRKKKR